MFNACLIFFYSCSKEEKETEQKFKIFSQLTDSEKILIVRRIVEAQANYLEFIRESSTYSKFGRKFSVRQSFLSYHDSYSHNISLMKEVPNLTYNKIFYFCGSDLKTDNEDYRLAITDSGKIYLLTGFYKNTWKALVKNEIKQVNSVEEATKVFNIYQMLHPLFYRRVDSTNIAGVKRWFPKTYIKLMTNPEIVNGQFRMVLYEWSTSVMTDGLDKAFVKRYELTIDKNARFNVTSKLLAEKYVDN